jgi:hypothetical protein
LEETQLVKFEYKSPKALGKESQRAVDILFNIYTVVYGGFDKIIHLMDRDAYKVRTFPNWFMTSLHGLGFQLLIIVMLALDFSIVIPHFL